MLVEYIDYAIIFGDSMLTKQKWDNGQKISQKKRALPTVKSLPVKLSLRVLEVLHPNVCVKCAVRHSTDMKRRPSQPMTEDWEALLLPEDDGLKKYQVKESLRKAIISRNLWKRVQPRRGKIIRYISRRDSVTKTIIVGYIDGKSLGHTIRVKQDVDRRSYKEVKNPAKIKANKNISQTVLGLMSSAFYS